jgi:adenine-specific DNA-methyltransferase
MDGRLNLSKRFSTEDGSHCIAIDKYEHNNLFDLCKEIFADFDIVSIAIEHNKKGTIGDHFSFSNEYAIFAVSNQLKHLNEKERKKKDWDYSNLRNWGGESERGDAANCFYPIYVRDEKVIGYGDVLDDEIHPKSANEEVIDTIEIFTPSGICKIEPSEKKIYKVWPIDSEGVERKWRYAFQSILEIFDKLIVETGRDGGIQIKMPKYSDQFKTLWADSIYNAGDNGTKVLTALGFTSNDFAYPKSIYTVKDCVFAISDKKSIVLDYFAGSGTTAQSVIMLNKADAGHRKFILCEMGLYFDKVTRKRTERVIYSDSWRDGKPVSRDGISQCFKYIRLEQYEDTLNNWW